MYTFKTEKHYFKLTTPAYDEPLFGHPIGELRLTKGPTEKEEVLSFSELIPFLEKKNINICTYRGKEDIEIIQELEDSGFRFISTYLKVICYSNEFKELKSNSEVEIKLATEKDFDEILEIEKTVMDFSTFSIDKRIAPQISSERNAIRVRSHFQKPDHRMYLAIHNSRIAGFLQFEVDTEEKFADTLNLGIHPDFQKKGIGRSLFSGAVKSLFEEGCDHIFSDYSTQNIGSAKLHMECGFRLQELEVHLRYVK